MTAPIVVKLFEQRATPGGSTLYPVDDEYDGPTGVDALEWALGCKGPSTPGGFYPAALQAFGLRPGETATVGVIVSREPAPILDTTTVAGA